MGEFNSDNHFIYFCGQESLRRNGAAIIVNKRTWNAVLRVNLKDDEWSLFVSIQSVKSVQLLSHVRLFVTPWIAARQASLSITNSWSSPELVSIESVMPSSHLNLCRPLLLLPSIFPRIQGLFEWVSSLHQVAKVLEFQLQHQSFQWTFRTDFFYAALAENVLADKKDRNKKPILVLKAFTFLYDREIINKINV